MDMSGGQGAQSNDNLFLKGPSKTCFSSSKLLGDMESFDVRTKVDQMR